MEFKEINLSEWKKIGVGGNGAVFVNDAEPGKLLKLNNNAFTPPKPSMTWASLPPK